MALTVRSSSHEALSLPPIDFKTCCKWSVWQRQGNNLSDSQIKQMEAAVESAGQAYLQAWQTELDAEPCDLNQTVSRFRENEQWARQYFLSLPLEQLALSCGGRQPALDHLCHGGEASEITPALQALEGHPHLFLAAFCTNGFPDESCITSLINRIKRDPEWDHLPVVKAVMRVAPPLMSTLPNREGVTPLQAIDKEITKARGLKDRAIAQKQSSSRGQIERDMDISIYITQTSGLEDQLVKMRACVMRSGALRELRVGLLDAQSTTNATQAFRTLVRNRLFEPRVLGLVSQFLG
jgi:hypothetical protein